MAVIPRTIKQGNTEYVKGLVTDITGQNISGATYAVALVPDANKADDPDTYAWETPDIDESGPITDSVYRVATLVEDAQLVAGAKAKFWLYVRVTDIPEVLHVNCGSFTIVP